MVTTTSNQVQADFDIHPPTDADLQEIARDLKLTPAQSGALREALAIAFSHINLHKGKTHSPQKRKDLIARMRKLEQVLTKLEYEVTRSQSYMNDYLPFDVLEMIGERSSTAFVKEALGEKAISPALDQQINLEVLENGQISLDNIDSLTQPFLKTIGLKSGPELFARYIKDLLDGLKTWRSLNAAGSARRPALIYRQHLIRVLIAHSEDILGKRAAKSPNGRFVTLCEQVLRSCGVGGGKVGASIPKLVEEFYPSAAKTSVKE